MIYRDLEGQGRLQALRRFTWALAAVTDATNSVAVYWGNASATHDPKDVVRYADSHAKSAEAAMTLLWTGVSVVEDGPDRVSLLTLAVQDQLGFPDVLVTAPREKAPRTLAQMFDLIAYVIGRGAAIPDGDTVGSAPGEKLRVRYVASPVHPDRKVARIDVP